MDGSCVSNYDDSSGQISLRFNEVQALRSFVFSGQSVSHESLFDWLLLTCDWEHRVIVTVCLLMRNFSAGRLRLARDSCEVDLVKIDDCLCHEKLVSLRSFSTSTLFDYCMPPWLTCKCNAALMFDVITCTTSIIGAVKSSSLEREV